MEGEEGEVVPGMEGDALFKRIVIIGQPAEVDAEGCDEGKADGVVLFALVRFEVGCVGDVSCAEGERGEDDAAPGGELFGEEGLDEAAEEGFFADADREGNHGGEGAGWRGEGVGGKVGEGACEGESAEEAAPDGGLLDDAPLEGRSDELGEAFRGHFVGVAVLAVIGADIAVGCVDPVSIGVDRSNDACSADFIVEVGEEETQFCSGASKEASCCFEIAEVGVSKTGCEVREANCDEGALPFGKGRRRRDLDLFDGKGGRWDGIEEGHFFREGDVTRCGVESGREKRCE